MATAYAPRVGDPLASLDTPSMVVDLDVMEANIAQLMGTLLPLGVRVRPHLKTTKCAALARRLVAAGATGGCVAKLSEAEALAARGFTDLLITCEVVGAPKVARLVALVGRHPGALRVVVDSAEGAEAIDAALAAAGVATPLAVLLDLDVGLHRTGVAPGAPALALAARVAALPRLRLVGVQGYEGHLQHVARRDERRAACLAAMGTLTATAAALRAAGHAVDVVTTGGTGTAEFCAAVPGVTEVQPGSFIFMDTDYAAALRDPGAGPDAAAAAAPPPYRHALAIRATVLSRQGPRAATIDAGLKSLTTDSGLAACADARYRYGVLGDEHGSLTWDDDGATPPLRVGDVVDMLPSHIDPTINLHDTYYAHRRGVLEEIWTVDARGMVQ